MSEIIWVAVNVTIAEDNSKATSYIRLRAFTDGGAAVTWCAEQDGSWSAVEVLVDSDVALLPSKVAL